MIQSRGEKVYDAFSYVFLLILTFVIVYPFIHALSVSFSSPAEAMRPGWHLYPREVSFDAYTQVFASKKIWIGYANTLYRTVFGTLLAIFVTAFAAFPLGKSYLPLRKLLMVLILITMLFDGGMIPTYLLMRELDLLNSRLVYILPGAANAFNVLVMMAFFRTIPQGLEESARIDGAGEWRVLFRIVLPLSMPVIATIGLWNAVGHWNSFMDNLLYVTDRDKFVLQNILREILIENRQDSFANMQKMFERKPAGESLKMAMIIVSMVPILVIYPFLLRFFAKGFLIGSIKG